MVFLIFLFTTAFSLEVIPKRYTPLRIIIKAINEVSMKLMKFISPKYPCMRVANAVHPATIKTFFRIMYRTKYRTLYNLINRFNSNSLANTPTVTTAILGIMTI